MKSADLKAMVEVLSAHTGILIVKADQQGAKQPPLPYGEYKITSPYIKGRGRGHIMRYETEGAVYERLITQPSLVVSLSFFAEDEESSRELAQQAHDWFQFAGGLYFEDIGSTAHHLGNVENRTTHIVDHYEYKHGFDVQIRFEYQIDRMNDVIETINT